MATEYIINNANTAEDIAWFQSNGTTKAKTTKDGYLLSSNGSVSAAGLGFKDDPASGLYRVGGGEIALTVGTSQRILTLTSEAVHIGESSSGAPLSTQILKTTDGGGTNIAGSALVIKAGRSTGTAAGGYLAFETTPAGGTSGSGQNTSTERLRIESNGTVKLGTHITFLTNPFIGIGTAAFVGAGGSQGISILSTGTPLVELATSQSDADGAIVGDIVFSAQSQLNAQDRLIAYIEAKTQGATSQNRGGKLIIETKANNGALATAVVIDNQQRVGIGLNPAYLLELASDSAGKPGTGTWTVVSDRKTKVPKSIRPYIDGIKLIDRLNPVHFTYNGKAGTPKGMKAVGLVAQDLAKIAPRMVRKVKKKLRPSDRIEQDVLGVNTGELQFTMINALKELNTRLQYLEIHSTKNIFALNKKQRKTAIYASKN